MVPDLQADADALRRFAEEGFDHASAPCASHGDPRGVVSDVLASIKICHWRSSPAAHYGH